MHRYSFFAEYTVSLALLFVIADQTANGCQRIVLKKYLACLVKLIFFQKSDDLRNRCLYGHPFTHCGFLHCRQRLASSITCNAINIVLFYIKIPLYYTMIEQKIQDGTGKYKNETVEFFIKIWYNYHDLYLIQ